jgi:putative AlgH/UPF0301 family transcriptional regulator
MDVDFNHFWFFVTWGPVHRKDEDGPGACPFPVGMNEWTGSQMNEEMKRVGWMKRRICQPV